LGLPFNLYDLQKKSRDKNAGGMVKVLGKKEWARLKIRTPPPEGETNPKLLNRGTGLHTKVQKSKAAGKEGKKKGHFPRQYGPSRMVEKREKK